MKPHFYLSEILLRIRRSELRVLYPFFSVVVVFMLFAYAGCKMPNDGIPVYIQMDSVTVNTTAGQGNGSHAIGDVWVEANSDNLGAYGLPISIPVLQEGDVDFIVNAGIKESGQSGVRVTYPFYRPDTFTLNVQRGQTYIHHPVFSYRQGSLFTFVDDFDSGNGFSVSSGKVGVITAPDPNINPAFGGFRCLYLNTDVDSAVETGTIQAYDLPEGQEIWLEIDYKAEVPFNVGFYGLYNSGSVAKVFAMFVTQQTEWKKVYVKLSLLVGQTRADTYRIYFEALRPYGSGGGKVYIDNVKLVHF
jgi:hypothetical protein